MYRKDQLKGLIALILFAIIGLTYFFSENENVVMTVSIASFLIWLASMYFLNRRF